MCVCVCVVWVWVWVLHVSVCLCTCLCVYVHACLYMLCVLVHTNACTRISLTIVFKTIFAFRGRSRTWWFAGRSTRDVFCLAVARTRVLGVDGNSASLQGIQTTTSQEACHASLGSLGE